MTTRCAYPQAKQRTETGPGRKAVDFGYFGRQSPAAHRRASPGKRQKKGPGDYPSPCEWWRRRELNPRPQALYSQVYMLSLTLWI